jgi:hypothetical protein
VILWWGLFDNELYVERDEQRADRIENLAKQINLPRAALAGNADLQLVPDRSREPGHPGALGRR